MILKNELEILGVDIELGVEKHLVIFGDDPGWQKLFDKDHLRGDFAEEICHSIRRVVISGDGMDHLDSIH